MGSSAPDRFDIFEIYRRYSDIKSMNRIYCDDGADVPKFSRGPLGELCSLVDKSMVSRDSETDQLINLMSQLNVKEDFSEFSNFYSFVFFICRENGQKSISVSRAIAAWRLVLSGRFRLLNQWCDFVEKNQRHNISEDTWCQVLAFSRCVHEDLEGYDPEGAWPVLIDDFVEHMYRIIGSSCCTSRNMVCTCADPESQLSTSNDTLPVKREKWCAEGLKSYPGLKRKLRDDNQRKYLDISGALSLESLSLEFSTKRRKQQVGSCEDNSPKNPSDKCVETLQLSSPIRCSMSPCAVEQCLSKGFEGLLSSPHSSV